MSLRQTVFENLIDDLTFDPKRGLVYLLLSVAALYAGIRTPFGDRLDFMPPVFAFGGLGLFLKGVFLLRKSSTGLGANTPQLTLAAPKSEIAVAPFDEPPQPTFAEQFTQLIQDFGTGPLLLGPFLSELRNLDESWADARGFSVFLTGLTLFGVGWITRRFAANRTPDTSG
jgi:hypothetical protein